MSDEGAGVVDGGQQADSGPDSSGAEPQAREGNQEGEGLSGVPSEQGAGQVPVKRDVTGIRIRREVYNRIATLAQAEGQEIRTVIHNALEAWLLAASDKDTTVIQNLAKMRQLCVAVIRAVDLAKKELNDLEGYAKAGTIRVDLPNDVEISLEDAIK